MRLASYVADGKACFGAVTDQGVITLNSLLGGRFQSLRQARAAHARGKMRTIVGEPKPDHSMTEIKWMPVIPNPEKILCAGINYRSHAAETGRELPKQPSMFLRLANTLTSHEGALVR